MTRRAWLSGLILALLLWAIIATVFTAGWLARGAVGHSPTAWSPVPSSALRGYVVHPGTLSRSDAEPDPTHPRRVLTASSTPSPSASVRQRPKATPTTGHVSAPVRVSTTARLTGLATWYSVGPGLYAAAGPALRRALGAHWRGAVVRVSAGGRSVVVQLVDWCACGPRHGVPTLLDLSADAFRRLAPLSRGVVSVTVSW